MLRICRYVLLTLLLSGTGAVLFAQADTLDFPAPQYMLPMYDHYSHSFLNADAMGRGFTGTAMEGGVDYAVNNPASLRYKKTSLHMEMTIKPPITELNTLNGQLYASPIPFGLFGVSFKLPADLRGAISYNVPKSIVYDDFTMEINQGNGSVVRYPSYYLHQFTATLEKDYGNLSLGLNLHNQFHQFRDVTVFYSMARIDDVFYTLRLQPGMQYRLDKLVLGATFTAPTKKDMSVQYVDYDVTLPAKLNLGAAYSTGNKKAILEADWENFQAMDEAFDNRLILKAGFESTVRKITYRAGVMHYPGVFEGTYILPERTVTNDDDTAWWDEVSQTGYLEKSDQLYVTGGFTYKFKGGKLAMGLMKDFMGRAGTTCFSMALAFDLETLKGRKFIIFDK